MAKSKKPAPKGGKNAVAPKKVVKKVVKKAPTARQADQKRAERIAQERFDSVKATFDAPLHQIVEEQYLAAKDAYAHTLGDAESLALHRAEQARAPKPPTRWQRFRSAITGLFVKKSYADANPGTTVKERAQ